MAIYSWFTHSKWWFSLVMLIYQRVLNMSMCQPLVHPGTLLFTVSMERRTRMRPPSQWRRGPLRWKNLGNDWGNTSEGWSCLCGVDFFVGHFLSVYIICSKLFEYILTCFNHPAKMVTDPHFWQEILYRISKDMFKTWKTSPARVLFLL